MALRTRLLKVKCRACGYTARITRKWLAEPGPPLCPCNSQPMVSREFREHLADELAAWNEAATVTPLRILREKWLDIRSVQECCRCCEQLERGEHCHLAVYTLEGAFVSEYTCMRCHPDTASQWERTALGYV